MVDQLWLYLCIVEIKTGNHGEDSPQVEGWKYISSAVITSFLHTSYPRSDNDPPNLFSPADIRQCLFEELEWKTKGNGHVRAYELASSILSTALLGMLSTPKDWSLDFLELFREAVGEVAEKHSELFRKFDESMDVKAGPLDYEQKGNGIRLGIEVLTLLMNFIC